MLNIARDRRKTLKKEKKTRKIRKSKTATVSIVLLLLFYMEKIIFLRQHIWKSFVCIVTFILRFSQVAGCWKCSNKTPTPI